MPVSLYDDGEDGDPSAIRARFERRVERLREMADNENVHQKQSAEALLERVIAASAEPGIRDAIALYEAAMHYYVPASGVPTPVTTSNASSTWQWTR